MVVFLLLVEFVLPGFVAAGFSRAIRNEATLNRVLESIFAPADWLSRRYRTLGDFYEWEFDVAGGQDHSP